MQTHHAVALVDHARARILKVDAERTEVHKVDMHVHPTGHHGSEVRAEHEFFAHVCDALDDVAEVLVAGTRQGIADFERYARKHRPVTAARIVGQEIVDHPTEPQLAALARAFFERRMRLGEPMAPDR